MICHAQSMETAYRQLDSPPSHLDFLVDNVATRAQVLCWADDAIWLSVDDPANLFQDKLFVPQLLHLLWRDHRLQGTLQVKHASSIGKLRILVSWHQKMRASEPWHGEVATLCAS